MMATWARSSLSGLKPSGMNSGNMTLAMNSTVISGTPRISSTYSTHSIFTAGSWVERRPSATSTASGKAKARPKVDRISVIGRPPQLSCGTNSRPSTPPHISTPMAVSAAIQISTSSLRQNRRMAEMAYRPRNSAITMAGRHCSS